VQLRYKRILSHLAFIEVNYDVVNVPVDKLHEENVFGTVSSDIFCSRPSKKNLITVAIFITEGTFFNRIKNHLPN
jgi:hypothetical protein